MRTLTSHQVNETNEALVITVTDEPGPGGANHVYEIDQGKTPESGRVVTTIRFQKGGIREAGVNGVTHEALLAILIDRLESFQEGGFPCTENAIALADLRHAQETLHQRTRDRLARGVEGLSQR